MSTEKIKNMAANIQKANAVYVRVVGTEWNSKITKKEAHLLNEHMQGNFDFTWTDSDLFLEGEK